MNTETMSSESPVKKVFGFDDSRESNSSSVPENREVAALNEDSDSDSEEMVNLFEGEYDEELARLACQWHAAEKYAPPLEKYAKEALLFLKDNKGEDYEFLEIKSDFPIYSKLATHLNFFARLKGSEASHLLFAEVDNTRKVVACSVVRYSDFYSPDIIIHPDGVSCWDCEEYNENHGQMDCCGELSDSERDEE